MEEEINKENDTITLDEMLKDINKEMIVVSKLNNKEFNTCTYDQGFITQELFACVTCYKEKAEFAAICVSCSLNCHKDHEMNHLYFKRNVRCDCGNSKFGKQILYYLFIISRHSLCAANRERLPK
jgi:E3 ubiquitin-protein ligase UBR7